MDAGVVLAVTAAVAVKMWPLLTPWAESRQHLGGDLGLGVEPYFYHELKRGILPLWDPTIGTGSPFLGAGTHHPMYVQAHLQLFYPLNLLWLGLAERHWFIPHDVLQVHHVVHYALAGAFAYLYGRVLGLGRFAGAVLALAFTFSGFLLSHLLHWTFVETVVWLPLILACVVRADLTERPRWGALAGLFLGIAFLAGQPQILYYVGLATVALGVTLLGRRWAAGRSTARPAATLLLVPAVALGVAAVQLLPSWALAVGSHRGGLGFAWKATGSLPPRYLLQLVLPWGLLSVNDWRENISEYGVYGGLLPLVLAGYALSRRWDWRVGYHAALALGGLLLAFGDRFGAYHLAFDLLPQLHLFRIPAQALALVSFALAVLAGLGAEALARDPPAPGLVRGLHGAAVAGGAILVGILLLVVLGEGMPWRDPVAGLADQIILALLLLLVILISVSGRARGHSVRALQVGLMVALVLDLVFGSFTVEGEGSDPDAPSAREEAMVQVLAADPGPLRIARRAAIRPDVIYRHGWGVFDGESTFAPPRFLDLYGLREVNPRLVDLLNVKYFVLGAWQPADSKPDAFRLWPGALRRVPVDERG